ncbi:MAG: rhodanese-like domain-containing protein [bacterium]
MPQTAMRLVAEARQNITEISPQDMANKLGQKDFALIDVREPHEFVAGHLPGAVCIPRGVLEFQVDAHPAVNGEQDSSLVDRDRELIIYCLTGGRAALAAESLQKMGYTNVKSIAGGWKIWTESKLPTA